MARMASSDILIAPFNFASLHFLPFLFSQLLHILDWRLEDNQEPGMICTSYGSWLKEESALSYPVEE